MEDYKTKYEKAIEQAKKELKTCGSLDCDAARQIFRLFPELKESEDEKIRKGIVKYLEQSQFGEEHYQIDDDIVRDYIAWLEKQDPKKHEEELENAYKCADEVQYRRGYEDAKREFLKQGEQKSVDKIEHKLDNSYACVKFPFKAKVKSSDTIVTIHDGQLSPDGKEWIKYQSDKEDGYKIYKPNNLELACEIEQKSLWSEEDEKHLLGCINYFTGITEYSPYYKDFLWLKSIKERYIWKPSDEQMRELGWVAEQNKDNALGKELMTLYQDLKKLKEE